MFSETPAFAGVLFSSLLLSVAWPPRRRRTTWTRFRRESIGYRINSIPDHYSALFQSFAEVIVNLQDAYRRRRGAFKTDGRNFVLGPPTETGSGTSFSTHALGSQQFKLISSSSSAAKVHYGFLALLLKKG